ncbi:MAG: Trk system potassium transporter TrkA [Gammaproteobacteria bacterium]|jgi:trk system potassium uptake protein TrkA|nr:Trk system potassium transporter TrkA [Gammaproteobacteria bacterium]MDG2434553.1 Trk system potassium transporter TrkA [Gammaproteobacteria bacterium]
MNILILGAGQVGSTTAKQLAKEEDNEITIVDINPDKLSKLSNTTDLRVVEGNASYPNILKAAGADTADMLVALTSSDEVNMIACQIASTLFNTQTKIARIRASEYSDNQDLFSETEIPVDYYINPEELITNYIAELIQHPGAFQVLDFAEGRMRMVGVRTKQQGFLVGNPISALHQHLGNEKVRIAAIYRDGDIINIDGNTVIQEKDEVYFIAAPEDIDDLIIEFSQDHERVRSVVIAGGGKIGLKLAARLERNNHVKLIEKSIARAKELAEQLDTTIVLKGDAADDVLLTEENINNTDVFVAVTNSEEANLLSSMVAKKLGTKKVFALINKTSYSGLAEAETIDVSFSAEEITISSLLSHVRKGDVVKVHTLKRGNAEALEAIAHDHENSKVVGKPIEEIILPSGSYITAVVSSQGEIRAVHHTTVIQPDDHVIVFISNREAVAEIETLFE